MEDLKTYSNEELLELYQKIEDEIKKLKDSIIDESIEEEEVKNDQS